VTFALSAPYKYSYLLTYLQKYPLTVFSISAAFDTIDHNILITRLSSLFGIHGSVIVWFKSYLSSRSFRVKCENCLSSSRACLYVVSTKVVFLVPTFILYTTTLSSLISSLSLNHHLYADDTRLFFSFYPLDLHFTFHYFHPFLLQTQNLPFLEIFPTIHSNPLTGLPLRTAQRFSFSSSIILLVR